MTKVINNPSDSEEGVLLVCLEEVVAGSLTAGDMSFIDEVSGRLTLKSFAPLFVIRDDKQDVAKKHNLHRWFKIEFEGLDLNTAAARLTQSAAVSKVQFNKFLKPASDGRFIPYVEPPVRQMAMSYPFNDPMLADQWHYINNGDSRVAAEAYAGGDIAVKDAWRLTGGDPRVVVAIIDGPVKYDHPDLAANMWVNANEIPNNGIDDDDNGYVDDVHGWNCMACTPQVWHDGDTKRYRYEHGQINWAAKDVSGHGTHVAGVVGAVNSNGIGVSGVAGGTGNNDGVRLMSCQIFLNGEDAGLQASALAFQYAADNGASVAQCSFGLKKADYKSDSDYINSLYGVEYDAMMYFMDPENNNSEILDGNIVIAAAGNERNPYSSYPAACQDVISVTGLGPDFKPATNYTNYGPGCNIAAPGGDYYIGDIDEYKNNRSQVLSTFISNAYDSNLKSSGHDYVYMQGTSMACPHVSGVAALGLAYAHKLGKKFTREEFTSLLLTSVADIDVRMSDNTMKTCGWEDGVKLADANLGDYRGKMGTGALDAWKFLMAIEGTPTLTVLNGKSKRYNISSYFGATNLKYISVSVDEQSREALGLKNDPEIDLLGLYTKSPLKIHPTKVGSGKITVRAIAGYDEDGVVDGKTQIGGIEVVRTISVMSRGVVSDNGGWL